MTIAEAIARIDRLCPNQYTTADKVLWLSKLDGRIWREVLMTHECPSVQEWEGYSSETETVGGETVLVDRDVELLVPYPYDEDVYTNFLAAQIAKENAETAKYNVSIALFDGAYSAYQKLYNRTHMPVRPTYNVSYGRRWNEWPCTRECRRSGPLS